MFASILLLMAAPASTTSGTAGAVRTEKAACNRIKGYVSAVEHFPASAIAFCDIIGAADSPTGFYVMALHSKRQCDGICSTNMGWFAVEKRTGRVFNWDTADMKLGLPVKDHP